jgi:outer membrane protein
MSGIRLPRLLPVALGALLSLGAAAAQSKVAIINLQAALAETAEIRKASAEMESKYKPRQAEMQKLQEEGQKIQMELQTMAGKLTAQAEAGMQLNLQRIQRDLTRRGEDLQADVDRERGDILRVSSEKMEEVVRKLAEEKGLDLVVDISNTVYFKPVLDITKEATAAYDKAHPAK